MIYEYALEPQLVAGWTDRRDCRHYMQSFEFGQGRVVSRYPKRWSRLVWDAFESTDDLAKTRLVELLARISERMVRRGNVQWDDSTNWLENAEREHDRRPFHAILARTNPNSHAHVVMESDLDDGATERWVVSRGLTVPRKAADMAEAVASLLRCSSIVVFVDPYFGPEKPRYRRPFEAFLERMILQRPGGMPKRIEIEVHTAADHTGTEEFFREECERRLPRCVPEKMRVRMRRLRQKHGGEQLHNRYILSDLGGVSFGYGLDEGNEGETDDITLMDRDQYELRWSQYYPGDPHSEDPPPAFEQEGTPVEVVGTRKLPKP